VVDTTEVNVRQPKLVFENVEAIVSKGPCKDNGCPPSEYGLRPLRDESKTCYVEMGGWLIGGSCE
jgi:hypothetical protein